MCQPILSGHNVLPRLNAAVSPDIIYVDVLSAIFEHALRTLAILRFHAPVFIII